jgi:hypothetical protein
MTYADELRKKTEEALLDLKETREQLAESCCIQCKKTAFKAAERGKYETTIRVYIYEENDEMARMIADMCVDELKSCGLSIVRDAVRESDDGEIIDGYVKYSVDIHASWYPESEESND